MLTDSTLTLLDQAVRAAGLQAVADLLDVVRPSLANAMLDCSRKGTTALVEQSVQTHAAELRLLISNAQVSRGDSMRDGTRSPTLAQQPSAKHARP